MGGTTTRHAYRYATGDDPATGLAGYFRNLAEDVDAQVPYVSSVAPAHKNGLVWYSPTTKNTQISDGTAWQPINIQPLSLEGLVSEVSVAAGNVALVPLNTPDPSYWTVSGGSTPMATVQRSGIWTLNLNIFGGAAGDFQLLGAIVTPAVSSWDGRVYTGRSVDWNTISRATASWTGYLNVGQQFGFYRANHDASARFMNTVYGINFVGVA
jgi:hypothetical protein